MADEELRRQFSRRLTYYLSLNGYNQADMARRMGVSTATAAKWCTGQSHESTKSNLCVIGWELRNHNSLMLRSA